MLKNMKLAPKLIASFVLVALIIVVVGIIGLNSIKNIATMSDIILDEEVPVADATMEMTIALISGRDVMGEYMLANDVDDLDELEQEFNATVADYDRFASAILNGAEEEGWVVIASDNEKITKLINDAEEFHSKFEEASIELMKFHKQALLEEKRTISNAEAMAYGFMEQVDDFSSKAEDLQEQAEILAGEEMTAAMLNADESQASGTKLMIAFSIVGFILAVVIGYLLSRLVSKPLQVITNASQEIALGDLNQEIHIDQKDEIGQLATAFKQMLEGLRAKTNVATEIARGNVDVEVDVASEKDALGKAMDEMKNSIAALIKEGKVLAKAAKEGDLEKRGEISKFQGGYREIIQGMNDTIENILKPVNEAVGCLSEMSKGDLSVSVTGNYEGDHAIMKEALNSTLAGLNDILSQVAVSAEQIASGSQQVSDSGQSLSQGATEQASSLEEVTSSMTEMGSQTKQNADNATQANQLA
ncbi:MAG: HAMP domain-containing protein, partial [candidate division Zixibacteria bacterium]